MKWTIQQHSIENPLILAYENKPLLAVEFDGKDDAIHTRAYKVLAQIVENLNKNNVTIDTEAEQSR